MGVKSINKLLTEYALSSRQKIYLNKFSEYRIAIDACAWVYTYNCGARKNAISKMTNIFQEMDSINTLPQLYEMFVNFNIHLFNHKITPVWVWDGPSVPEKINTQEKRRETKAQHQIKIENVRNTIEAYHSHYGLTNSDHVILQGIPEYKELTDELRRLLGNHNEIRKDDMETIRLLSFNIGLPTLQSDSDAESLCASLAIEGLVSGVWSKDTDNYALGTPIMITEMSGVDDENQSLVTVVIIPLLRAYLGLTQEQFRDLCIMCGVDFNDEKNIPNYGPKRCHKLIREHGTIENIGISQGLPVETLNYERCRELLTPKPSGLVHESQELHIDYDKLAKNGFIIFNQYGIIEHYDYYINLIRFVPKPKKVDFL